MKQFFKVNVSKYVSEKHFFVYRPASLNRPKNNAVMFIMENRLESIGVFSDCQECLIFWPKQVKIPFDLKNRHAVYACDNPHNEYCRFFSDNSISHYPDNVDFNISNGAYICKGAVIGDNCRIFPGAYIGSEVQIGNNVYIGSGVKLLGEIKIGNNVVIRENAVLGSDGLSTDRDENGKALTMPQFGGIIIEDDVQIGALTVVGRGAIDDTIIKRGVKIDNCCFVSHNVYIGEDTFIVGETIMFGSSSTGKQACISGNATIREGISIGNGTKVGMGSVVTKSVKDFCTVKGNPAR